MPSSRASVGAGRRRSSDEIHRLLLEAASELFAEKGYAATTTREIGVRAGVPEVMLFRHFGSKASLFSEASLQPFNDFLSQLDRKRVGEGKSVSVRVELGGRRIINKKK